MYQWVGGAAVSHCIVSLHSPYTQYRIELVFTGIAHLYKVTHMYITLVSRLSTCHSEMCVESLSTRLPVHLVTIFFGDSISRLPQATLSRGQAPREFLLWLGARPPKILYASRIADSQTKLHMAVLIYCTGEGLTVGLQLKYIHSFLIHVAVCLCTCVAHLGSNTCM